MRKHVSFIIYYPFTHKPKTLNFENSNVRRPEKKSKFAAELGAYTPPHNLNFFFIFF
jgi:hypothetical protein